MRGAWCVGGAALLLVAGAAGCRGLGGVRPRLEPFPSDSALSLAAAPPAVIAALQAELENVNVRVQVVTGVEGYLESGWHDAGGRADGRTGGRLEDLVKFRFFADPVSGRTRLVMECARRIIVDPSLPERELERPVPAGHAGRVLMDSVVARAVRRLDGQAGGRAGGPTD